MEDVVLGLSCCSMSSTGFHSGRSSPRALSTQIRFLWRCCRQVKLTMPSTQTLMVGLVAGNRWVATDQRGHRQGCASVRGHLRLGQRSQRTESTPMPLVGQRGKNKGGEQ